MSIMIKPSHKGLLHAHLGLPQGTRIPVTKLVRASKNLDPTIRKEAKFALNARAFKHVK